MTTKMLLQRRQQHDYLGLTPTYREQYSGFGFCEHCNWNNYFVRNSREEIRRPEPSSVIGDTLESDSSNDDDSAGNRPRHRVKLFSEFKKRNFNEGLNINEKGV